MSFGFGLIYKMTQNIMTYEILQIVEEWNQKLAGTISMSAAMDRLFPKVVKK